MAKLAREHCVSSYQEEQRGDREGEECREFPAFSETKASARPDYELQTSWSACLDDQVTFGKKSGGIFIKVSPGQVPTRKQR